MIGPDEVRLCLVTDRDLALGRSLREVVAAAVRGGVTMVQLREKALPTRDFVAVARDLLQVLRPSGVPLVINDRLDVALAAGAQGVHVGQEDMPVEVVRRLLGPDAIVGLSITSLRDLSKSNVEAADYFGVGPIFSQTTKADAAAPLGLAGLAAIRREAAKPLMAIGGIGPGNAEAVRRSGAEGIAVVSAILSAEDPEEAAAALLRNG